MIEWSLRAARVAFGDHVVLVVPPDRLNEGQPLADRVVAGGESRAASVRAGLAAVPADAKVIVVHDGARPFATPDLFTAVVTAVNNGADAAVPAIVVVDTLKRVDGTTVVETLDRSSIVAVQTPQAFRATVLRDAHRLGGSATDDAALVEAIGGTVVWVAGSEENRKLTTPEDLWWFTARAATR